MEKCHKSQGEIQGTFIKIFSGVIVCIINSEQFTKTIQRVRLDII